MYLNCPYCGQKLTTLERAKSEVPDGSSCSCVFCGEVAIFDNDELRKVTPYEMEELMSNPDAAFVIEYARMAAKHGLNRPVSLEKTALDLAGEEFERKLAALKF